MRRSGSGEPAAGDRERLARPRARIREARWLAARGATAMIDVSDGLGAELGHLAAAGAVRIVLEMARVPAVAGGGVEDALAGGEEYELAVAAPQAFDAAAFHAAFGVELTEIGVVEEGAPEVVLVRDGARVDLPAGYDHFSR